MTTQQMELGFDNMLSSGLMAAQQRRANRASWWFERMRQIVDRAMDWEPAPLARPEQTWFEGTQGEAAALTRPVLQGRAFDEREIGE